MEGHLPLACLLEEEKWMVPEVQCNTGAPRSERQENPYTHELLRLQQCTPARDIRLNPPLAEVNTPLQLPVWRKYLADHPDVAFRDYILEGIQEGFRVGYDYQSHKCYPATGNLKSARENAEVVEAYIAKEVAVH